MPSPLNPLNWIKSAQDWFAKTEKSSGFRPFLIFLILVFGLSVVLLTFFHDIPKIVDLAIYLISGSAMSFIGLFIIKAFQDPNFCRSETHVERIQKMQMEKFGTETRQIEISMVNSVPAIEQEISKPLLPNSQGEK